MHRILFVAGNLDAQLPNISAIVQELSGHCECSLLFTAGLTGAISSRVKEQVRLSEPGLTEVCCPSFTGSGFARLRLFQMLTARLLEAGNFDLIVLPNHKNVRHHWLALAAKRRGFKVVVLQDGLGPGGLGSLAPYAPLARMRLVSHQLGSRVLNAAATVGDGRRGAGPRHVTHANILRIGVWGEASRETAMRSGYDADQVVVVGCPRFDRIARLSSVRVQPDPGEVPLVVYLPTTVGTSYFSKPTEQVRLLTTLATLVDDPAGSVRVIVKLHRQDSLRQVKRMLSDSVRRRIELVQNVPLYPLLARASVVLTTASTAGLEALLMGKFLVTVNLSKRRDFYSYAGAGAAISVNDAGVLGKTIADLLTNSTTRARLREGAAAFLRREISNFGCASTYAAEFIVGAAAK